MVPLKFVFSQPRKLMGSSPQKSSGVHWCRRRVRFNEAPKFPEKGEASGAEPGQVQGSGEGSGEGSRKPCMVQSQVRFNRVPEKVPREGSGEEAARSGSTAFRRRFGEAWCGARSGSTGFLKKVPEKVWKALVQSQVRFNRVPEKVPEKVPRRFRESPGSLQRRFRRSSFFPLFLFSCMCTLQNDL